MEEQLPPAIPPPPPSLPPSGQPPLSQSDERLWGLLAHVSGIFFFVIGPLVCWLIQKDKSTFVDDQGKEALNFNILMGAVYVGATVLAIFTCGIGGLIFPLIWFGHIVLGIIAGIAANKGELYRYPFNWRLIK